MGTTDTVLTTGTAQTAIDVTRFVVTLSNFIMTVIFAMILLSNAFNMEGITGLQVFHADRILQTSGITNLPPASLSTFIKQAYGADTEITKMIDETELLSDELPTMYEVAGSNSMLRIEAVHCNFMLFSALWIASAFSLTMVQVPSQQPLYWSHFRVVIVHMWNLIGLIATAVIFSATTKWNTIPTSNLLYALIGQVMAWMYQYFHMVECTQIVTGLQLEYVKANWDESHQMDSNTQFTTEMRKMMYMEFSIVAPMMFIAGIMPGAIGFDEWRVQTLVFASWALFALLGLHLRWCCSMKLSGESTLNKAENPTSPEEYEFGNFDAVGYLTYAIVVVYAMLFNVLAPVIWYDSPYATEQVSLCRAGARALFVVSGVFVLETVAKSCVMKFLAKRFVDFTQNANMNLWGFGFNLCYITFGSFLVKILLFSGISNVNGLTEWSLT